MINMEDKNVICFGGEDWWYHNRGHVDMQLMKRFAVNGNVLYVNSIVMQKPSLKRNTGGGQSFSHKLIRKVKSIFRGLRKSDAGFWVFSPLSLPVHHIAWLRPINNMVLRLQIKIALSKLKISHPVVWVACPAACEAALAMKKNRLVYQRTDRFEDYPNVDSDIIRSYDQRLKEAADLTVFVNSTLYEEEKSQCKEAIYLDHGVDFEMFASACDSPEKPEDIASIDGPIVGFFGGIDDHTSDVPFVEKVVDLLSEMRFVFVGKASSDVSRLAAKPNVHMLGQKPYEQIPHYGKCFDVAIMPWQQNSWIAACNPIKLKEYLALGKPVVSTPFVELQKYSDVTFEAKTPEDYARCITRAIAEDSAGMVSKRRDKIRHASWESKAQLVIDKLFCDGDGNEE